MEMVNDIKVMEVVEGVKVINICHLIDKLFGKDSWGKFDYKEVNDGIMKWVKDNNAHYYADVKEDFFVYTGVCDARKAGKTIVVVENMS